MVEAASARLSGKVALITGAGQGVGRGIALALASEGARIAVAGRTLEKLRGTVEAIAARGGRAIALCCDVRQPESLADCVARTVEAFSGLHILVNNAQEVPLGALLSTGDEAFTAGWESGPLATLRLMKLAHPHLARQGGCIVNLGSSAAKRWDLAGYGAYAAVKEAIRQLTRAAACEWAHDGIRSNCILPLANSPAMDGWSKARPEESAAFVSTVPQGRVGDCESDIGRFVATLCSDDCRYVNGQSIALDGGQAFLG